MNDDQFENELTTPEADLTDTIYDAEEAVDTTEVPDNTPAPENAGQRNARIINTREEQEVVVKGIMSSLNVNDILSHYQVQIIDLGAMDSTQAEKLVKVAIWHCFNGPVGLNKETDIPGLDRICVRSIYPEVTSKGWEILLETVKELLPPSHPNSVMYMRYKDYYPCQKFKDAHPDMK